MQDCLIQTVPATISPRKNLPKAWPPVHNWVFKCSVAAVVPLQSISRCCERPYPQLMSAPYPRSVPAAVCSSTKVIPIDRVRVIGERINPTGKKLMKEALRRGDVDYMLGQALEQVEAGADILDVNVGLPDINEEEMMVAVKAIQGVTDAPLQLDSTDPAVLSAALRIYCGKAIVNSVNGEDASSSCMLPLVKKYGAAVVGLTLDERGIPQSAGQRVDIARHILARAQECGIAKENVYIDCLTLTVSAEPTGAVQTLTALKQVKEELGLKTVLGVSNISFGLPARGLVNQNFLTMAMAAGLDLPILNPNVDAMMAAVRCYHLLTTVDENAANFIAAYGNATVSAIQVFHGLYAQVDPTRCVGCGKCVKVCPASVIHVEEVAQ